MEDSLAYTLDLFTFFTCLQQNYIGSILFFSENSPVDAELKCLGYVFGSVDVNIL